MTQTTNIYYDSEGDMLEVNYIEPYMGQETEELEDGIFVLFNHKTLKVEGFKVLSFKKRFSKNVELNIPEYLKAS